MPKKQRISIFDNSPLNKARLRNEQRRRKARIAYAVISVVLILAAVFVVAAVFCKLETVELSGSELYTEAEIMEAANIKYGEPLFSVNTKDTQKLLMGVLSGIEEVKISYSLPNKLKINIKEGTPFYSMENNGELYYMSEDFIALGKDVSVSEDQVIYRLGADQVKYYKKGKPVVFYDDDWYYIVEELVSSLKLSGLSSLVTVIETKDKFDLVVRYDARIRICLGEFENIIEKLEFAKNTIVSLGEETKGTIRVKNYKVGSFLKDEY